MPPGKNSALKEIARVLIQSGGSEEVYYLHGVTWASSCKEENEPILGISRRKELQIKN